MSGAQSTYPLPISLGTLPAEGSKVVAISQSWALAQLPSGVFTAQYNLLSAFQSGRFTTPQAVMVDNSTVAYSVTLAETELGQRIVVPPFSQGMYPLLASAAPQFTATLNAALDPLSNNLIGPGTTRFYFLNTPQRYYENTLLNFGTTFLSFAEFVNLNARVTLLQPLADPTMRYAFSSLGLTISLSAPGGYPTSIPILARIFEVGNTQSLWEDGYIVPTTSTSILTYYSRNFVFPTPLIQRIAGSSIALELVPGPAGGSNAYPASNQFADVFLTYGILQVA